MSHIWRESPRKWLERNGYGRLLEPFDRLIAEARAADVADPRGGAPSVTGGMATVKWARFRKGAGLDVSFERWCLRFGHEDLLAQWDAERNGALDPGDVTRCDARRVWWRCGRGHSWQAAVRTRSFDDSGCPYCGRRKALAGFNSAECLDAAIAKLWHPTRNGALRPGDVSDRTKDGIWFLCPDCGCEWRESLRSTREGSRRCPACAGGRQGFVVAGVSDLASVRPDVAAQLDPALNGGLEPDELSAHSCRQVWWRAACGHV